MKRIFISLAAAWLIAPAVLRAQDAAVEERLNKLSAQIEDLVVAKDAQTKRIEELAKAVREIQDQQNRPNANYASQEDVKHLAEKLQEIDRKRQDDNERILKELEKLGKTMRTAPPPPRATPTPPSSGNSGNSGTSGDSGTPTKPLNGFEYEIKEEDTLSAIVRAYREKGVKVTVEQIQNANPGLKEKSLKPGQKIFIPGTPP